MTLVSQQVTKLGEKFFIFFCEALFYASFTVKRLFSPALSYFCITAITITVEDLLIF